MQLCPCAVSECNKVDVLIDVQMCGFDCANANEQDKTEYERGKKVFHQKSFTHIFSGLLVSTKKKEKLPSQ